MEKAYVFYKTDQGKWGASGPTNDDRPLMESIKEIKEFCERCMEDDKPKYVKPPLGVMPKWLWEEKRCEDLREAINRAAAVNGFINVEIIYEYNELVKKAQNRKPEYTTRAEGTWGKH